MKKLLIVGVALALLFLSDAMSAGPVKLTMLALAFVLSASVLVHGVITRRRRGQSWNEALAGDTKLITGNVWLDGALFTAVLLVCCVAVALAVIYF